MSFQTQIVKTIKKTEVKRTKTLLLKRTFKRTTNRTSNNDKGKRRTAAFILHKHIIYEDIGGANITIDLWCGNGKRTHGDGKMKVGHQMANMCGGRLMQPNLRNVPFVIDPFAFKQVGGKYVYPQDKDKIYYHHRRGFEDCFEHPQNVPFRSCL